jgi:hypothetical protein
MGVLLVARALLILIALTAGVARLHRHAADAVDTTQEMNRCLLLVNVATSRRQTGKRGPGRVESRVDDRSRSGAEIGLELRDVEESTSYGASALGVRGTRFDRSSRRAA